MIELSSLPLHVARTSAADADDFLARIGFAAIFPNFSPATAPARFFLLIEHCAEKCSRKKVDRKSNCGEVIIADALNLVEL